MIAGNDTSLQPSHYPANGLRERDKGEGGVVRDQFAASGYEWTLKLRAFGPCQVGQEAT
jgi:hypothetical protein